MKLTPLQHKALSGLAQAGSAGESAYGLRVSNGTLLALALVLTIALPWLALLSLRSRGISAG